jgi:hypothetical protein
MGTMYTPPSNSGDGAMYGGGGGGGGGDYSGNTYGGQYGPMSGQTFYGNPELAQKIMGSLAGPITQTAGMLPEYLNNPTASPAFQNTIQGLLAALAPSEAASRTALSDQARAAGNMSSGAYGVAGANLEGDIMRNRGELASKTLLSTMGPTIQAILGALGQGPQLLESMRLSQQYRAPQQQPAGTSGGSPTAPTTSSGSTPNQLSQLLAALAAGQNTNPQGSMASGGQVQGVTSGQLQGNQDYNDWYNGTGIYGTPSPYTEPSSVEYAQGVNSSGNPYTSGQGITSGQLSGNQDYNDWYAGTGQYAEPTPTSEYIE